MRLVGSKGRRRVTVYLYGKVTPARTEAEKASLANRLDMLDGYDKYLEWKRERDAEWERREAAFNMKALKEGLWETERDLFDQNE